MSFPKLLLLLFAFGPQVAHAHRGGHGPQTTPKVRRAGDVKLTASDGLVLTATVYAPHAKLTTPFIVLLHQAGWSRGEYLEIAPKLNALGFNALALDQRSGGEVNGVVNLTHQRAEAAGLATNYVDAMPDLEAAVSHARRHLAKGKLLLWGSSYSAALALKFAGDHPERIDGVLSFAPGEYFERFGKPADWIGSSAKNIDDPAFITSARKEKQAWWGIYEQIPGPKAHFLPKSAGNHGSRALWEQFEDSPSYWRAVENFLSGFSGGAN